MNFAKSSSGSITSQTDVVITSKAGGVSGDIIIKQGATELGRWTSVGLGVGTTPVYELDVNGVAHASTLNSARFEMHGVTTSGVVTKEPLINFYNQTDGGTDVLKWQIGLDVANSLNDDLVLAVRGIPDGSGVQDVLYLRDYGTVSAPQVAFGFGYTPPPSGYRVAISAPDNSSWGALRLRMGASTTGPFVNALDSAGNVYFQVKNDGSLRGVDNAINALGLAISTVGNDASNVLTVTGSTTATADILNVGLSGQTAKFAIRNDGGSSVKMTLTGGNSQVTFRNQTQIATLVANSAADLILVMKMAATPSGAPLLIQKSDSSTLFTVTAAGNVGIVDGGNITVGATTGTKIATSGGAAGSKLGFFGATPVVQPLLATGAAHTVDDVIATLQTLGLVRQS